MQPYIYGSANPVTYSDPSGLCTLFSMDEDGDWVCEFYPTDGPRVAVDNDSGFGGRCNVGSDFCSIDEGNVPLDYVFQRPDGSRPASQPEEYIGVPTGALEFVAPTDWGQEIWERRRGLLQFGSTVAGGVCIAATWGGCTPLVATLAAANVAQSAEDNLLGDKKCVSNFFVSAGANVVPLGVNRAAGALPGELVDAARSQVGSMGLVASSGISATNTCGGD